MRKYHRWLSVIFGLFLLWIAATGLLSHGAALYADAIEARDAPAAPAANPLVPAARAHENEMAPQPVAKPAPAPAAAGFVCPETMTCRVKPDPEGPRAWVGFFHHLHAGEEFGPIGTLVSILSGLALLFFAFSGLWLYVQMFRARASFRRDGDPKWFWK